MPGAGDEHMGEVPSRRPVLPPEPAPPLWRYQGLRIEGQVTRTAPINPCKTSTDVAHRNDARRKAAQLRIGGGERRFAQIIAAESVRGPAHDNRRIEGLDFFLNQDADALSRP